MLSAAPIEPLPSAVTSSSGVAEPALRESGRSLRTRVDATLYRAKKSGRNRVVESDAAELQGEAEIDTDEPVW